MFSSTTDIRLSATTFWGRLTTCEPRTGVHPSLIRGPVACATTQQAPTNHSPSPTLDIISLNHTKSSLQSPKSLLKMDGWMDDLFFQAPYSPLFPLTFSNDAILSLSFAHLHFAPVAQRNFIVIMPSPIFPLMLPMASRPTVRRFAFFLRLIGRANRGHTGVEREDSLHMSSGRRK